jgi:hypothetical protein
VDGVVPSLLVGLDNESHYAASVEGLRVILGVRPTTFNGVAPKLLRQPVTSASLRALGDLAGVAGGRLAGNAQTMCVWVWHMTINILQQSQGQSPVADTHHGILRCHFCLNMAGFIGLLCDDSARRMTNNSTATIQGLRPMQTDTLTLFPTPRLCQPTR